MAGKSTERAEIEELIRISDEARSQLGVKIGKVSQSLKMPVRLMGSMRHSPKSWLFGSMAAGLLASLLLNSLPGGRKKKKRSRLKKKALALTLTAARPIAKVWLANKLKSMSGKWIAERVKPEPSPFQIIPNQPTQGKPNPNPQDVRTPGS